MLSLWYELASVYQLQGLLTPSSIILKPARNDHVYPNLALTGRNPCGSSSQSILIAQNYDPEFGQISVGIKHIFSSANLP